MTSFYTVENHPDIYELEGKVINLRNAGIGEGAFLLGGEGNSLVVVQEGNANLVEGSMIGSNSTVVITQLGDGNIATVTQE